MCLLLVAALCVLPLQGEPDPLQLVSGEQLILEFDAGVLEREFQYRATGESDIYLWTESDEVDLKLEASRPAGEFLREGRATAAGAAATFVMPSQAGDEWRFLVRASAPGTATFQFTAVEKTVASRAALTAAEEGLEVVSEQLAAGDRPSASRTYRAAVEAFHAATGERCDWATIEMFWTLADTGKQLRDSPMQALNLERIIELRMRQCPPRSNSTATARLMLAFELGRLGEFAEQKTQLQLAIVGFERIAPSGANFLRIARVQLGIAMAQNSEFLQAEEVLADFLRDYSVELSADSKEMIDARMALANLRFERGDMDGARIVYEQLLPALMKRLPANHRSVLITRSNLANVLGKLGRFEAALAEERAIFAALEASGEGGSTFALNVLANTAQTLKGAGRSAEAIRVLEEVLAARQATLPDDHPAVLSAQRGLSDGLSRLGDYGTALELNLATLEAQERSLPAEHPHLLMSQRAVASCLLGLGRSEEMEPYLRAFSAGARQRARSGLTLSARERASAARTCAGDIDALLVAAETTHLPWAQTEIAELIESLRVLTCSSPEALARGSEGAAAQLELDLAAARQQVAETVAILARGEFSESQPDLAAAIEARDLAERALLSHLAERGLWYLDEVSMQDIAAALPSDAVAISFWRGSAGSFDPRAPGEVGGGGIILAQVLEPGGALTTVHLATADLVVLAFRRWRAAIGRPFEGDSRSPRELDEHDAGADLRALLLDPLVPLIGDRRRVYLCLDDVLHLIPLDALPLGEGCVGDRYDLRTLGFLGELSRPGAVLIGEPSLLVAGDIDYGAALREPVEASAGTASARSSELFTADFRALPGTAEEARLIATAFEEHHDSSAERISGAGATRLALMQRAPGRRYLHLATHGAFSSQVFEDHEASSSELEVDSQQLVEGMAPLSMCGLAMAGANAALNPADGILTGEELAGLDLSSCELAVLSACETGVGMHASGQGLWSLQRALRSAGANSTLTSLWTVDDEWTQLLMREFYSRLWCAEPRTPAQALWEAKLVLRRRRASTRDWAGWVLCGDLE